MHQYEMSVAHNTAHSELALPEGGCSDSLKAEAGQHGLLFQTACIAAVPHVVKRQSASHGLLGASIDC